MMTRGFLSSSIVSKVSRSGSRRLELVESPISTNTALECFWQVLANALTRGFVRSSGNSRHNVAQKRDAPDGRRGHVMSTSESPESKKKLTGLSTLDGFDVRWPRWLLGDLRLPMAPRTSPTWGSGAQVAREQREAVGNDFGQQHVDSKVDRAHESTRGPEPVTGAWPFFVRNDERPKSRTRQELDSSHETNLPPIGNSCND